MSKVLIYNLSPEKHAKLKMLCRKMNIEAQSVEKSDYDLTMGDLLDMTDNPQRRGGGDFDDEMLYIAGLSGGFLNIFLDQLRRNKLVIPLKAVATETNLTFTSAELHRELCAEREAIAKGLSAHQ